MNEWAGFFLGVMALCAVVQCAFVVLIALNVKRGGERVADMAQKFDTEIRPAIDDVRKGAANLRAISDSGREQARRIEELLETTLDGVEATIERVRTLVEKPLESLSTASAFWGGLRSGLESFRSSAPRKTGTARRSEDSDEHMFIG